MNIIYFNEKEETHFKNKIKDYILNNYSLKFIECAFDKNYVEVHLISKNVNLDNFKYILFIKSFLKDFYERDIKDIVNFIFQNGINFLEKKNVLNISTDSIRKNSSQIDYNNESTSAKILKNLYKGKGNFNVLINKLKDSYKISHLNLKGEIIGNNIKYGTKVYLWKFTFYYKGKQLTKNCYLPIDYGNNALAIPISDILKGIYKERLIYFHYNLNNSFNMNLYRMDFGVSDEHALKDYKKFIATNLKLERFFGSDIGWFDTYFNSIYNNNYNLISKNAMMFK